MQTATKSDNGESPYVMEREPKTNIPKDSAAYPPDYIKYMYTTKFHTFSTGTMPKDAGKHFLGCHYARHCISMMAVCTHNNYMHVKLIMAARVSPHATVAQSYTHVHRRTAWLGL